MTDNLKQILEMSRAGTITDEQAAALIQELTRDEPRRMGESPTGHPPFASFIHSTVNRVLDHTADVARAFHGGPVSDGHGNELHLSHVDQPRGMGFIFRSNQLRMSKVTDLKFEQAEMSGNKVDATRLDEVRLSASRLVDSEFNSSSLTELRLATSEIQDLGFISSKGAELTLSNGSAIRSVRINCSVVKELRLLDETTWEKGTVEHSVMVDLVLRNATLTSCEFREMKMKDVLFENSTWKAVGLAEVGIDRTVFLNSRLEEVTVVSSGHCPWKKRDWSKLRVENCQFRQISFTDCRLADTILRDITLEGLTLNGLDLSHQTLVGNDAFLRAIATHRQ